MTAPGLGGSVFGQVNEGLFHLSITENQEILVTANILGDDSVYAFDLQGQYGGALSPWVGGGRFGNVERGPDGRLYTSAVDSALGRRRLVILEARGPAPFASSGAGWFVSPELLTFGPDRLLYVADPSLGIVRLDPSSGALVDVFVPMGRGGLYDISRMRFGPDGRLYVASRSANAVLRFGPGGEFIDVFVTRESGGLDNPVGLAFGPDGSLYVASRNTRQVLRYDGDTGEFLRVAFTAPEPNAIADIAYLPDTPLPPAVPLPAEARSPGNAAQK